MFTLSSLGLQPLTQVQASLPLLGSGFCLNALSKTLGLFQIPWRWRRETQFASQYFQDLPQTIGILTLEHLTQNNQNIQVLARCAEVLASGLKAEIERRHILAIWNYFHKQRTDVPLVSPKSVHSWSFSLYWQKFSSYLSLAKDLAVHCYYLNMHLLDIYYALSSDPSKRAPTRYLLDNVQCILHKSAYFLQSNFSGSSSIFQNLGATPTHIQVALKIFTLVKENFSLIKL